MPKYFVHLEEESKGPMPEAEVQSLIAAGRLEADDWAMRETDDEWSTIGELFPTEFAAAKTDLAQSTPSAEPATPPLSPAPQTTATADATAVALQNQMLYDAQKKSAGLACFLNFFFPGIGYLYAGRIILGLVVFFILLPLAVILGIFTFGLLFLVFWIVVIVDAYRTVERHNRKLAQSLLPEA